MFLKINNINEIEKLKNNLLIKDKLFYQISNVECENFKSHFKEIENEILTHYCSEHKTLDLKSGWLSSHTTAEPFHNHIFLDGNHVMIQVLDVDNIDWNDPRHDAYYDPHDDCVEYPNFLHNCDGNYGSNYDGGYDSY